MHNGGRGAKVGGRTVNYTCEHAARQAHHTGMQAGRQQARRQKVAGRQGSSHRRLQTYLGSIAAQPRPPWLQLCIRLQATNTVRGRMIVKAVWWNKSSECCWAEAPQPTSFAFRSLSDCQAAEKQQDTRQKHARASDARASEGGNQPLSPLPTSSSTASSGCSSGGGPSGMLYLRQYRPAGVG